MKITLYVFAVAALGSLLYKNFTFMKTLFLIAHATPVYQQSGTGDQRLLLLGDSTGYGTGAANRSETTAGRIGSAYPQLTIENNSVNGRTAIELLEVAREIEGTYDVILMQIGANDLLAGDSPRSVVETIAMLVELLRPHATNIIVLTSGNIGAAWRFEGEKAERLTNASRTFDALMKERAETEQFSFVSLWSEPAVDPFVQEPKKYTAFDGLHPTSAGYGIWFESLDEYVNPLLRK